MQKLTHSFQSNTYSNYAICGREKSMEVNFDKDKMNLEQRNQQQNQSWLKVQLLKLKNGERFAIYYLGKIYRLKLLVR